jgi:hypothetical protein
MNQFGNPHPAMEDLSENNSVTAIANPLESLDEWEADVLNRYPEEGKQAETHQFRDYESDVRPQV